MDKTLRNTLRNTITQCRRLLEKTIGEVLQGQFGIHLNGIVEDAAKLVHLPEEDRTYREQLVAHLRHIEARGFKPADASAQLVREAAFTHLNRLCAYKMLERRKLIREAVSKGLKSSGFLYYLSDHLEDEKLWSGGHQDTAYRHFLEWLGGTLSQEIGVLFSPHDPANRLFPPQRVLDEVLALINHSDLDGVWGEDETIGWVYQYFTPKELRDQARKESAAPRNSYELAFRNQFFTPRYVVEFLVDNTLGRMWYDMRGGNTRLGEMCRYMVRRPDEVILDSAIPEEVGQAIEWLQNGKESTFPAFDRSDDAMQRLIDLAHTVNGYSRHPLGETGGEWAWTLKERMARAGTLEGFSTQDMLDVMFYEVRADRMGGGYGEFMEDDTFMRLAGEVRRRALNSRRTDLSQEELLRQPVFIPGRPKKDPRELRILDPACGSGHFLLYCFDLLLAIYEEAYEDPDLGPALQQEYPTPDELHLALPGLILAHNLHGIDIDLRATQIAALALWLRAQRAYADYGIKREARPAITRSNIVCAEPMPGEKEMLGEFVAGLPGGGLRELALEVFDRMALAGEAGSLLKIEQHISGAVKRAVGDLGMMFADQAQERWQDTERRLLDALQNYAESTATNGQAFQRTLFAEDAAQGLAFIDVCSKVYSVVLMNPPFGAPSIPSKAYIEKTYPRTKNDVYAAFVERGLELLHGGGMLGAITSRTGFFLSSFQKWREEIILKEARPTVVADLGMGVLDSALVETAAYCLEAVR